MCNLVINCIKKKKHLTFYAHYSVFPIEVSYHTKILHLIKC